jgi:transposase
MLFDVHNHAFRVFGGIPGCGVYDNMRTAIEKVGHDIDRCTTTSVLMARHCLDAHHAFLQAGR